MAWSWRRRVAVAAVSIALGLGALAWGSEPSANPPVGSASTAQAAAPDDPADSTTAATLDSLATEALQRQARALRMRSRSDYLAAWDPVSLQARQRSSTTYANLRKLGIRLLETRSVETRSGLSLGDRQRLGGVAWQADVAVSFASNGYDTSPARMVVSYTFVKRGGRAYIVDTGAADGQRQPVWSFGRLEVRRTPRTLVAATTRAAAVRVSSHLRHAVRDLEGVLPDWDGTLVAYVAGSTGQLDGMLAASPGAHDGIAAVTTTVDGSMRPAAPVAIVVNASVFDELGQIGSHVVITHEATHAATKAAVSSMPLWVAEGFADYVGIGAVRLPLSVAARTAFSDVRRHGVPTRLPTDADFGGPTTTLEVHYQRAWLAAQLIADKYGEKALVDFYRAVVRRPDDVATALADLGTNERSLVDQWRALLARSAGSAR